MTSKLGRIPSHKGHEDLEDEEMDNIDDIKPQSTPSNK
jgi:hypothetical protein